MSIQGKGAINFTLKDLGFCKRKKKQIKNKCEPGDELHKYGYVYIKSKMNSSQDEFPTGINILPSYIQFHLEMIKNGNLSLN